MFLKPSRNVGSTNSNSVDLWTQTNIDDILCHGDRQAFSLFPRCARLTKESVTNHSKDQLKSPYYYMLRYG